MTTSVRQTREATHGTAHIWEMQRQTRKQPPGGRRRTVANQSEATQATPEPYVCPTRLAKARISGTEERPHGRGEHTRSWHRNQRTQAVRQSVRNQNHPKMHRTIAEERTHPPLSLDGISRSSQLPDQKKKRALRKLSGAVCQHCATSVNCPAWANVHLHVVVHHLAMELVTISECAAALQTSRKDTCQPSSLAGVFLTTFCKLVSSSVRSFCALVCAVSNVRAIETMELAWKVRTG